MRPTELYRIAYEATVWTWTSGDEPVEHGGETYTPETIGRSDIEQGSEINRQPIQITLPRTNALARQYLIDTPDHTASVTIFRRRDETFDAYWKGRIAGASATGSEVRLECESVFTSLRRTGLRARYQGACRHALYHRG